MFRCRNISIWQITAPSDNFILINCNRFAGCVFIHNAGLLGHFICPGIIWCHLRYAQLAGIIKIRQSAGQQLTAGPGCSVSASTAIFSTAILAWPVTKSYSAWWHCLPAAALSLPVFWLSVLKTAKHALIWWHSLTNHSVRITPPDIRWCYPFLFSGWLFQISPFS